MNVPANNQLSVTIGRQVQWLACQVGAVSDVKFNEDDLGAMLRFLRIAQKNFTPLTLVQSAPFPSEDKGWKGLLAGLNRRYKRAVKDRDNSKKSLDRAGASVLAVEKKVSLCQKKVDEAKRSYSKAEEKYKQHVAQKEALRGPRDAMREYVEVFDKRQDSFAKTINWIDRQKQKNKAKAGYYRKRLEQVNKLRYEWYKVLKVPRNRFNKAGRTASRSRNIMRKAMFSYNDACSELYKVESPLREYQRQQQLHSGLEELCNGLEELINRMSALYSVWSEWNVTSDSTHAVSPSVIDQCDNVTAPVDSDSVAATATGGHSPSNACTASETPVERILDRSETIVDNTPTEGIPVVSA